MKQPPVLQTMSNDDEEAEIQAVMARRHASEMVRDHLETHAANNPGTSSDYVTWIATLHPENAEITIDQRFFIPGNPWWTIYEETKNNQIPTATAVPVSTHEEGSSGLETGRDLNGTQSAAPKHDNDPPAVGSRPSFCMTCSPVNLFFGCLVSFHAFLGVLLCEMFALALCHFPAALFYRAAQIFEPPNVCTGIIYSVLMLIYYSLSFCDSIVLMVSVLIVEVIANVGFLVGFLTGGFLWGRYWHQQVRRMCHSIRVMCRKSADNPPRHFMFCCDSKRNHTMDQQNFTAESVPVHHVYHESTLHRGQCRGQEQQQKSNSDARDSARVVALPYQDAAWKE
mmetsp:Transcript_24274/g.45187  ORF Transcript_24274/g.45187 Transcript_24274/m.45187 type:complete len:339 (+) Transcript_24274:66-1082(+)